MIAIGILTNGEQHGDMPIVVILADQKVLSFQMFDPLANLDVIILGCVEGIVNG